MSLFVTLLSLAACWESPSIPVEPVPASITPGAWEIQILDVNGSSCDGLRPADLVGQSIYADLRVRDSRVWLSFEGWELAGSISGSDLFVEGAMYAEPMPADEPTSSDDDVDYGEDTGSTGSDGGGSDGGETPPDGGDREEGDDRDDREEPSRGASMSLDARILGERLAEGDLALAVDGCALDLAVVLAYTGDGGRPPVGMEEDEDTAEPPPRDSDEGEPARDDG